MQSKNKLNKSFLIDLPLIVIITSIFVGWAGYISKDMHFTFYVYAPLCLLSVSAVFIILTLIFYKAKLL